MPVYVQHEALGKVNDVFNAETIWQAPGLALFSRRPLLRDLLERSPRELRGRAPTRCFSHVTLLLAQEELDDDRHLTRGARARDLTASLKALHQRDFGDLLGNDEVRYDVRGTEQLEPGEVQVKFGHAVYLPMPGESVLYQVACSRDGMEWQAVCPIYLHQRLALIGQDQELASHAVPGWPFGSDGAILLVNDGPEAPIEVQVRPKNAFDCSLADGVYSVTAKRRGFDTGDEAARLLLKVERVGAPRAAPTPQANATVWKSRGAARAEGDYTAVPANHLAGLDATCAPQATHRVTLAALALPRLSRYRDTGAIGIDIGLDAAERLASDGAAPARRVTVDTHDHLQSIAADGSALGAAVGSAGLHAVKGVMAERYCAILKLAEGASVSLRGAARLVFGRGSHALSALRVLDAPRFLRRADGPDTTSADRLGLSRNAFSFEPAREGFQICRLSPAQALFHLDPDLALVGSVEAASADAPYLIPSGHHLVAGHYILRFDA